MDTNTTWEYFVDLFDNKRLGGAVFKNLSTIDSTYLNFMGASGWELVQIETLVTGTAQVVNDVWVYWRRPSVHQWTPYEVTHPTTNVVLSGRRCNHCGQIIDAEANHNHAWGEPLPSDKFKGRLYQECAGCKEARYIDD